MSSSSDKVIVHFLNQSRAESIIWILEELAVPYEIKYYRRQPSMLAPKELKAVHPLGKSPVITHGDLTIAETGNIIDYLLRTFGKSTAFNGSELEGEAAVRNTYFAYYSEGSLMPILVNKLVFSKFPAMAPWYVRPVIGAFTSQVDKMWLDTQLKTHLAMIDGELQKSSTTWICGGEVPTAADFSMYYPLLMLSRGRAGSVSVPESIQNWVKAVEARPALKAAYTKLDAVEKEWLAEHPEVQQASKL